MPLSLRRIGETKSVPRCGCDDWTVAYCDLELHIAEFNRDPARCEDIRMSSDADECRLKGGHPPAVKAGGMRITQHKTPKDERETKPSKDIEESRPSSSPPKTIMISGAPAKGNADFPPEAVQHFHEKPTPTHDARPAHCSRPIIIHQPRK